MRIHMPRAGVINMGQIVYEVVDLQASCKASKCWQNETDEAIPLFI